MVCKKDLFDLDPHIHFINGAYMSPLTKAAAALGEAAVRRKLRPYSIPPTDFFSEVAVLKDLFATLVGAPSGASIALIPAVSYGMATVARNLKGRRGQNIVVTEAQFPSNIYAWRKVAAEQGLTIKTVPYPSDVKENRGAIWQQRVLEAIDTETLMVAAEQVHWANGSRLDLKTVRQKTHEVGALLVIDGTQSVGAHPFDVADIQPDALVCGGYKWLLGPYSLGYAYYGPYFSDGEPIEETWMGRAGAEDFNNLVNYQDSYAPGNARFDMGEKSQFVNVPMAIQGLKYLLEWTPEGIQNYCHELTADAIPIWQDKGFWVEDRDWRGAHLFSLQLPEGRTIAALQAKLTEKNILVSSRGSFVRISPNIYNDATDIQALTDVLCSF